ncbi:MAG: TrbC/VirB2 family protein [Bradyrhizobium sp.]
MMTTTTLSTRSATTAAAFLLLTTAAMAQSFGGGVDANSVIQSVITWLLSIGLGIFVLATMVAAIGGLRGHIPWGWFLSLLGCAVFFFGASQIWSKFGLH